MNNCPKCGISWIGQDIMEYFQDQQKAEMYGWTPENPIYFGKNMDMVEYGYDNPYHYDGASEIKCKCCGTRIGRFSGKFLMEDEYEQLQKSQQKINNLQ